MKITALTSLACLALGAANSAFASVMPALDCRDANLACAPPVSVPEPGVTSLLIVGLLGLAFIARRRAVAVRANDA